MTAAPVTAEQDLCREIGEVYARLSELPGLEPEPEVNALFSRLVGLCDYRQDLDGARVLDDPGVRGVAPALRRLCADGEYRLERWWARSVLAADDPERRLTEFPYWRNYAELTALELHALAGVGIDPARRERACFVGGGPLPLSPLLLSRRLGCPVEVVDRDLEAVDLAGRLLDRLGVSDAVRVRRAEAAEVDVSDCDILLLAALVGMTRAEKAQILARLAERARPGTVLIARGAAGLRRLLYPEVLPRDLRGWRPLAELHPFNAVVNSVTVAVRR